MTTGWSRSSRMSLIVRSSLLLLSSLLLMLWAMPVVAEESVARPGNATNQAATDATRYILGTSRQHHLVFSQMARSILQDRHDEGFLISGVAYEKENSGVQRGLVLKTSASGDLKWHHMFMEHDFSASFYASTQLTGGAFILVGNKFTSHSSGDEDVWIVKIDGNGKVLQELVLGKPTEQNDGYSVVSTSDGGFAVVALALPKNGGLAHTWLIRCDANLEVLWEKHFRAGFSFDLVATRDGGFALAGGVNERGPNNSVYLLRVDGDGNLLWEKIYRQVQVYMMHHCAITEAADGQGLLVAGKNFFLLADAHGEVVRSGNWAYDIASAITLADGTFALAGVIIDIGRLSHAHVLRLSRDASQVLWENTSLDSNSGFLDVISGLGDIIAPIGWSPAPSPSNIMLNVLFSVFMKNVM